MSEDLQKELVEIYGHFNSVLCGFDAIGYSTMDCEDCCSGACTVHDKDQPIEDEVSNIEDAAQAAFDLLDDLMRKHNCLPEWAIPQPEIEGESNDLPY